MKQNSHGHRTKLDGFPARRCALERICASTGQPGRSSGLSGPITRASRHQLQSQLIDARAKILDAQQKIVEVQDARARPGIESTSYETGSTESNRTRCWEQRLRQTASQTAAPLSRRGTLGRAERDRLAADFHRRSPTVALQQ